jgi:hypothetical protein
VQPEGEACIPFDLSTSNATGLSDGMNVTIQVSSDCCCYLALQLTTCLSQVLYNGDDGNLFDCADVTLVQNLSLANVTCQNGTSTGNGTTPSGGALSQASLSVGAGLIGLFGVSIAVGF